MRNLSARPLGALVFLMGLMTGVGYAQKWTTPRLLVVPGSQVGPIRIGEPLGQDVYDLLGSPDPARDDAGNPYPDTVLWGGIYGMGEDVDGIVVHLDAARRVDSIRVGPKARAYTSDGLYLGMPVAEARKRLKVPMHRSGMAASMPGLDLKFQVLMQGDLRLAELWVRPIPGSAAGRERPSTPPWETVGTLHLKDLGLEGSRISIQVQKNPDRPLVRVSMPKTGRSEARAIVLGEDEWRRFAAACREAPGRAVSAPADGRFLTLFEVSKQGTRLQVLAQNSPSEGAYGVVAMERGGSRSRRYFNWCFDPEGPAAFHALLDQVGAALGSAPSPATAGPPAGRAAAGDTPEPVARALERLSSARVYSCVYTYRDKAGTYVFDYAWSAEGPRVRSEIMPGSKRNVGLVLVYDPREYGAERIGASLEGRSKVNPLSPDDPSAEPLRRSVFDLVIEDLKRFPVLDSQGPGMVDGRPAKVLRFSRPGSEETMGLWLNDRGEILQQFVWSGNAEVYLRGFSKIRWNGSPRLDF